MSKRILYIGTGAPWEGGAGFLVRQNLFLGALGRVGELHLAMFNCESKSPPPHVKTLTGLPSPTRRRPTRLQTSFADYFSQTPRMFRGFDVSDPSYNIKLLQPESFDAVVAYRIDFAHFAGISQFPRLILDIDDPEHRRWQRRITTTAQKIDRRTRADIAKLANFEANAVNAAKLAFVCQENDAAGWPPGVHIEVVPNCIELIEQPIRRRVKPIVLFVGNCAGSAISPNVDAVIYFLNEIWPKILVAIPDAEFHLVGAASDVVRAAALDAPRTHLLGFVDNLAVVYAEAAISIAPLRFGTGTRIKILEAFSYACPVVATPMGAEGISAIDGKDIELAATSDEFAASAVALLRDPQKAEQIGQAGHALAARLYDRRIEQDRLVARFTDLLNEPDFAGRVETK